MFGEFDASMTKLDKEHRTKLANLLAQRSEYMVLAAELNKRKAELLNNPTEEGEKELTEYSSAIVAPARLKMVEQTVELMQEAVDVEQIKKMLPMLATGLLMYINVPLVFNILGFDPDMIEQLVRKGKDFLSSETE